MATGLASLYAPVERLVAALSEPSRQERVTAGVLLGYVALWTLYAVLAKSSQDIHPDVAEAVVWSRELALGYPKHPPLVAWLTAAWTAVFPVADWALYLLAMISAGVALWIAWRTAADYLSAEKRVLALALVMLVPFFNFQALNFNANTVLIPLWAATAFCFLRSYELHSPIWAALAGLCAAGAMLGKYWSIFLLAGLGLAAILDPRRAAYFRSSAPWITIAFGAVAFAPNLIWLWQHDFAPLAYAAYVHGGPNGTAIWSAIGYLAGSAGYVALPVLLTVLAARPNAAALRDTLWPATPDRRLAAMAFWFPLLLPAVVAPLIDFDIISIWSMSAWTLFPVILLSSSLLSLYRRAMQTIVAMAIVLPPLMVAAAPPIAVAIHNAGNNPTAGHRRLLAERAAQEWRRVTEKPLRMIGGDPDLAVDAAFYLPGKPSAFPDTRPALAPWVTAERLRRDGIAIICRTGDADCMSRAERLGLDGPRQEVEISRSYFGIAGPARRYVIMLVPPQP